MCNYENCIYDNIPDSEYCIFHLKDDGKNIEEFNDEINRILDLDGEINFKGFYFPPGTGNFEKKSFNKNVCFEEAIFKGEANFKFVHFSGVITDFTRTKFKQNVYFTSAEFKKVSFDNVEFCKDIVFLKVIFLEDVEFNFTKFFGNVAFQEAKFINSKFKGSKFFKDANFQSTEFNEVNFSNVTFDGKMVFITENSPRIYLDEATFSNDVRIKAGLQNCSFYGSNIERVDLTNCRWTFNNKKEIKILEHKNDIGYDKLVEIYRRLRQSCQRYGDHFNAGEFFYQEMDCKRKQMKGGQKIFWNLIFKEVCGYGERPIRVIRASAFSIIFFALFYFYNGIMYIENGIEISIDHQINLNSLKIFISEFDHLVFPIIKDFFWCFYISIITFTTLGYGDVHPVGFLSRLFASIESLIGIFMTATLIFVFSRKMLR